MNTERATLETPPDAAPLALGTADPAVAEPFADAIRAHLREDWPQWIALDPVDGGARGWVGTMEWFPGNHPRQALFLAIAEAVHAPVLDVGAGCGRAARLLQDRGLDVLALDCEPACIEALQAVGVEQRVLADIRTWETTRRFRTILLLDSTIGLAGTPEQIGPLLDKLATLLAPDGVVIVQDVNAAPRIRRLHWRFTFRGKTGASFHWMNVSFDGLRRIARKHHWHARKLGSLGPYYAAELRPENSQQRWKRRAYAAAPWIVFALWMYALWR